eukprot:COSAG05_NODE_351_length_10910_cov_25.021645_7_plen_70_part_00
MINMTVKENLTRIIRLEDDVEEVKERLYNLETNHLELMTKLETIARIGKLLAIMVSATLGFDLGMEEMI